MSTRQSKLLVRLLITVLLATACNLFESGDREEPDLTSPTEIPLPVNTPVSPESSPASPADKWSLWTGGTQLRGANIYQRRVFLEVDGSEFMGPGPFGPPYTQADFDNLAALGANYVNISTAGLFTVEPPYEVDEEAVASLDGLLEMAAQAKLFAVISFRTGPGRSEFAIIGGEDWLPDKSYIVETVWSDEAARAAWAEMWRYTAQRYRDNPIVVGYDLMCEPNSNASLDIWDPGTFYADYAGTGYDWNAWYPNLVSAVREVDGDTPILVGGNGYSGVEWLPYLQPVDDAHIVYTIHQYAPQSQYTHQEPPAENTYPGEFDLDWDGQLDIFDRSWLENLLSIVTDFQSAHGVVVAVNEYGLQRWTPGGADYLHDEMTFFEQYGWNYAVWMWHASWPPLVEGDNNFNFRFGPDPENVTEVDNDLQDALVSFWSRNMVQPSDAAVSSDWWRPGVDTTWQWQLTDPPVDPSFDVDMYDIEMFDNDASAVAALHAQGRIVICYISVGSWEDWRPDAGQFPAEVIGKDYSGWEGEKWLDIRQIDLLAPIMRARLDQCAAKGFDGVEPDNIDGYTNDTGFPLTYEDQLAYNIWLANEAHSRGLSIGLKNDGGQARDLLLHFDWAMTEDCFAQDWCEEVLPFIEAGKPVFAAEYTDTGITTDEFCPQAIAWNFSAILKNRDLDAYMEACQ